MRRLLLFFLSGVSLALSAATVVLWVRGHDFSQIDEFTVTTTRLYGIYSLGDEIYFAAFWNPAWADPPHLSFSIDSVHRWSAGMYCYSTLRMYGHAVAGFGVVRTNRMPVPGARYPWVRIIMLPDWLIASVFAAVALLGWLRLRITVIRRKRGCCPTCGYDLRATPDRCPECGTPVATPAVTPSA